MRKACIFVDGENLRHSIVDLFDGEFDKEDYLPKNANWDGFFDQITQQAPWDDCERIRTYWYVVDKVDFTPWGLKKNLSVDEKLAILQRNKNLSNELQELDEKARP